MDIPFYWTEKTTVPNLPELLDNYRKHGGAIVQYEQVLSCILYSQRTPKFEWVGPDTSRGATGYKHALRCFFLGWWSVTGFFWTASAIITNLMGGIDVTRILASPPPLPGQPFDDRAVRELQAAQKRQQFVFLVFLLVLLAFAASYALNYNYDE